jgi:hypothetical protein
VKFIGYNVLPVKVFSIGAQSQYKRIAFIMMQCIGYPNIVKSEDAEYTPAGRVSLRQLSRQTILQSAYL